jgi:hypothetical protein
MKAALRSGELLDGGKTSVYHTGSFPVGSTRVYRSVRVISAALPNKNLGAPRKKIPAVISEKLFVILYDYMIYAN